MARLMAITAGRQPLQGGGYGPAPDGLPSGHWASHDPPSREAMFTATARDLDTCPYRNVGAP